MRPFLLVVFTQPYDEWLISAYLRVNVVKKIVFSVLSGMLTSSAMGAEVTID